MCAVLLWEDVRLLSEDRVSPGSSQHLKIIGHGGPIGASKAGRITQAFHPPCISARSTRPGSTTMSDSAKTVTHPTATTTGTCPAAATATAPTATARA